MTKAEKITGIIVGAMLGSMALLIFSFVLFINSKEAVMEIEQQNKLELISRAKGICDVAYSEVLVEIQPDGTILTLCKNRETVDN